MVSQGPDLHFDRVNLSNEEGAKSISKTKGLASVCVYIGFNAFGYSNGRLAEKSISKRVETETAK